MTLPLLPPCMWRGGRDGPVTTPHGAGGPGARPLRSVRDQGREEESNPLVRIEVRSPSCLRMLVELTTFGVAHIYNRGHIGTIFAMPLAQVTFGERNRREGEIRVRRTLGLPFTPASLNIRLYGVHGSRSFLLMPVLGVSPPPCALWVGLAGWSVVRRLGRNPLCASRPGSAESTVLVCLCVPLILVDLRDVVKGYLEV